MVLGYLQQHVFTKLCTDIGSHSLGNIGEGLEDPGRKHKRRETMLQCCLSCSGAGKLKRKSEINYL